MDNITPMINLQNFNETFKYFDKQVIVEIIDLFIAEYPHRCLLLDQYCESRNYAELNRAAHSLKGVLASFLAVEAQQHARELEDFTGAIVNGSRSNVLSADQIHEHVVDITSNLKSASGRVVEVLKELRNNYV